ncbi:DUF6152 family protein [Pelagibacterium xiamenense]|uniref:DUF6152 family protein n=1 Tax=Pelagibacterium xiamenense TaxID=2901140 RepID=UPI001E432353|nr:DUF6152 family protein [Pelagibacterium xiamenense]MCD7058437.1 DUF6152 family protein [Pelagibacterium xiamenense]
MSFFARVSVLAMLTGLPLTLASPALAHHGWAWTSTDARFELSGTLTEIYIGHPHATVEIDDGETIWHVDLAPLAATLAAGFDETAVAIGEPVTVIGHRAADAGQARMKAVRVVTSSGTFDVYPRRAAALGD